MDWYWILIGYLFGSTPTGFLAVKLLRGEDIRNFGSGNIGATNVGRVLGQQWAVITALVDMFKGGAAVGLARLAGINDPVLLALVGLAGVLGHNFPVWLRFKGGKGVATSFGVLFFFYPAAAVLGGIVWYLTMKVTRYVSVASMFSLCTAPVWLIVVAAPLPYVWVAGFFGILTIFRHRQNVVRLLAGTENKVGAAKETAPEVGIFAEAPEAADPVAAAEAPAAVEVVVEPEPPAEPDEMDDFLPDWAELPEVTEYDEIQEAPAMEEPAETTDEDAREEVPAEESGASEEKTEAPAGEKDAATVPAQEETVKEEAQEEAKEDDTSAETPAEKKPAPRKRTARRGTQKAADQAAGNVEEKADGPAAEEKKPAPRKRRSRKSTKA